MTTQETVPTAGRAAAPWQDPALPVADRVELLLAEMTLEEKVAQLGSRWVGNDMTAAEPVDAGAVDATAADAANVAPMQHVFAASGATTLEEASRARARPPHPGLRQRCR